MQNSYQACASSETGDYFPPGTPQSHWFPLEYFSGTLTLGNCKATQPELSVGPSSAHQQNANYLVVDKVFWEILVRPLEKQLDSPQ